MAEDKESPTIEEPTEAGEIQTDGLLEELAALNITDPKQIQDIMHASQQTGRAWNEVGELRQQVAQLQQQAAQPASEVDYSEGQPVDIKSLVKNAVREFYVDEVVTPQRNATTNYYRELNEIQSDPDYGNEAVQKLWNQYSTTPNFQMKLQSGQTTMRGEYDRLVRTYYREVLSRSEKTIRGLTGDKGTQTPYVEAGQTRSVPEPVPADERKEAANKIDKKRRDGSVGSDDALRQMIDNFLPKQDPIWQQE